MHHSSNANVLIPAILSLEELGFTVTVSRSSENECWNATKAEVRLTADDPLQLLGLSKLLEVRGESWGASDPQIADVLDRFQL